MYGNIIKERTEETDANIDSGCLWSWKVEEIIKEMGDDRQATRSRQASGWRGGDNGDDYIDVKKA